MKIITKEYINEIIINKSQFITYLAPVNSTEEAKKYLNQLRISYPDATHHCSAYIVGLGGEFGSYNDDGEPSGTAGMPIFDVLRKNDLTNCICVVIRYFGGIKLGAGGLVRAYSKSASETLKLAEIVPIINYDTFRFSISYRFLNEVELLLSSYEITHKTFSDIVTLEVKVPISDIEPLKKQLVEKCGGQITFKN